ncbi:MAG: TIGR00153 family protein [bacterium]|nr:TIGR00153 family protein [bacterium]
MDEHIRTPMKDIIKKSPFDGLLAHAAKVEECVKVLKELIECYCNGNYEKCESIVPKIVEFEQEADTLKIEIRKSLPRNIFMSVDKTDFLTCLSEQDTVLDFAEDIAIWLTLKHTKLADEVKELFLQHFYKVLESIKEYGEAIVNLKDIVRLSLRKISREATIRAMEAIHEKEREADLIEHKLGKKIFELSIDAVSVYHLLKATRLIGALANHMENAGNRVIAMIVR